MVFMFNTKVIDTFGFLFLAKPLVFMSTSFAVSLVTPHWERENFLWEQEQLKESTLVQSHKQKRKSNSYVPHRVRFAANLYNAPTKNPPSSEVESHDTLRDVNSVCIGDFNIQTCIPIDSVFSRHKFVPRSFSRTDANSVPVSSGDLSPVQNSNQPGRASQPTCYKCLAEDHSAHFCSLP